MSLEQSIGLTAQSNAAFASSTASKVVAYPAGACVVVYSPKKNKQLCHFIATKAVSCVAISLDGSLIAAGERGIVPGVIVWSLESKKELVQLKGHRFGVSCISFSPTNKLLVSIGFEHDQTVNVWDWKCKTRVATARLSRHKVSPYDTQLDRNVSALFTLGIAHSPCALLITSSKCRYMRWISVMMANSL